MGQRSDSRDRLIHTAVDLFRRQGYHATAFSQLVAESGAPRGSIYFLFPGGKEELALAAVALAAREAEVIVAAASQTAQDGPSFVRSITAIVGDRLEDSDYQAGCAIATMVLELAPQVEHLREQFDHAFGPWRAGLAGRVEA